MQADLGVPVWRIDWEEGILQRPVRVRHLYWPHPNGGTSHNTPGRWFSCAPADLAAMRERIDAVLNNERNRSPGVQTDAVIAALFGSSAT